MQNDLSSAIDFFIQIDKVNPFHQHLISNNTSKELITLRLQCYTMNKLSLLALHQQPKLLQLYGACIINAINNVHMPYKNIQSVKRLVWHLENYYQELKINQKSTVKLEKAWPTISSAFMLMQDKMNKISANVNKEYVMVRRGLLQTNKDFFVSQMMAKKVETPSLRQLINHYKNQTSLDEVENIQTPGISKYEEIKDKIRSILFDVDEEVWTYLLELQNQKEFQELGQEERQKILEYFNDILGQYESQKIQTKLVQKVRLRFQKPKQI